MLPYGKQNISEADIEEVVQVLRGDWLTTGPVVEQFEQAFAARVEAPFAAACANGTAALHLAALALRLGPGDLAIVPSITFLATANALRFVGADVVFADVDPRTGLMTADHAAAALQRAKEQKRGKVKAILPVHLAGQCADPAGIAALATENGLHVVEDACHAVGTTYRADGETCSAGACRHADLATFSFHPVKTLTTGEGGMVTGRNEELIERVKLYRSHGMSRDEASFENRELAFSPTGEANPWYYEMPEIGFNYRLTDIACALGVSQLQRLDAFLNHRRELVSRYHKALEPLAPLVTPMPRVPGCEPGWHLFVAHIDFDRLNLSRTETIQKLKAAGIGSQVHYIPVHVQPYYRKLYGDQHLPGAESYYKSCLSLPLYPDMTDADVDRVASALGELCDRTISVQ